MLPDRDGALAGPALSTFRVRLAAMVVTLIAPLLVLALWMASEGAERSEQREHVDVRRWVRLLADGHARVVDDARQLLLVLSRIPAVLADDREALQELFTGLLSHRPRFLSIGLARPDGEVLVSAASLRRGERAWVRARVLKRAVEMGHLVEGRPAASGRPELPALFLAQPVQRHLDRVLLYATVELASMDPEVARSTLPSGATATLWDRSGIVLSRYPGAERWQGVVQTGSELFASIRTSEGEGTVVTGGLDGQKRLYGFTRFEAAGLDPGLVLALGVPVDAAFADSRTLEKNIILAVLGATFLALGLSWLGGERLVVRLFGRALESANVDSLTGLASRRHLLSLAHTAHQVARRFRRPLSALMIDLDRFKAINDEHGHGVGDAVLREVACRCAASLRDVDVIGRYGGEEFLVLLPESGLHVARETAERLRHLVAQEPVETRKGPVRTTISVGAASLSPGNDGLETLVELADQALFTAKASGRNRVAIVDRSARIT
jgi:diguanylate cyclase (GGDEF)-like protein